MDWLERALVLSRTGLARLVEHSFEPVVLLGADARIRFANPAGQSLLGFDEGALLERDAISLVHPDDREHAMKTFAALVAEPHGERSLRLRLRNHEDDWRAVRVSAVNLLAVDELQGVLLGLRDVTDLARAERALEDSELRFRDMADSAPDFVFRYRVSEPRGFEYASPLAEELTGFTAAEFEADPDLFSTLLLSDDNDRLAALDWSGERHRTVEFRLNRVDGSTRWVQLRATVNLDGEGRVDNVDGIVRDMTDLRAREDALIHRALHDSLTGLPNRALLYERLEHSLRRADRRPGSPVVLFVDLDGFKSVNDRFGHAAGDDLLVEVGRRLVEVVRPGDTVARLGGDEFLVLCDDVTDDADLEAIADRLRWSVSEPIDVAGDQVRISAAVGAARARPATTADELVHAADVAMYDQKQAGASPGAGLYRRAEIDPGVVHRRRWDDPPEDAPPD